MENSSECSRRRNPFVEAHGARFIASLILLGMIVFLVIFGNSLVIAAVAKSRKLRTVTNLFIVSLAFADLLLGIAILPFSATLEVLGVWLFGRVWCSMWLAIDVWLCTASILNLCAISLDRYIAITRPMKYPSIMSSKRGKILIAAVWIFAFVVCLPPLLGWNEGQQDPVQNNSLRFSWLENLPSDNISYEAAAIVQRLFATNFSDDGADINDSSCPELYPTCELASGRGYRIYSAIGSFYFPMLVMAFFYFRIYKTAVKTAASLRKGIITTRSNGEMFPDQEESLTLRVHRGKGCYKNYDTESQGRGSDSDVRCLVRKGQIKSKDKNNAMQKRTRTKNSTCSGKISKGFVRSFRKFEQEDKSVEMGVRCQGSTDSGSLSSVSCSDLCSQNKACQGIDEKSPLDKRKARLMVPNSCSTRRRSGTFSFKAGKKNLKTNLRKFKRETKAAKTLGIIVGAFILCWLPFFTVYLADAFCEECIPPLLFSVFFWLGYFNSALNPCIYALFSKDFRFAFKSILVCQRQRSYDVEHRQYIMKSIQVHSPVKESESLSEI